MKILKTIITLWIIFISTSVLAQGKARISGNVMDSDGNPLEIALVSIKGAANGAITNDKGFYAVTVNKDDSCTLVFSCMGYHTSQRIIPNVGGDMVINVQLKSLSVDLREVTILGGHVQTNTMERLDPGKTKLMTDASGGNIESMIIVFGTGVSSTNELSSQYSVRGGSYDENIIYVNGIEVYRPLLIRSGQQEGLSFINPDLTANVAFSSGGYEARYGDKMSSVLDITYKKPEDFEASIAASFLGANVSIGSKTGNFSQITGFRYKRGTSLLNTLDTDGDYDPTYIDFQTYMTYNLTPKLELGFLGNASLNTYDFYPSERSTSFGTSERATNFKVYYDGQEKDKFNTLFGAFTLNYALNENTDLGLQASGFQSKEQEAYDIAGEYWLSEAVENNAADEDREILGVGRNHEYARNYLTSEVFNISHTGTFRFTGNTIKWAVSYQRETIHDRVNEWEKRDSMGYSVPYNQESVNLYSSLYSSNSIESSRMSAYLQDTYKFRLNPGLFSLTAGIRGSYWDFNDEFIFSPRASIGFIPSRNQNFTFRFATGLYYQAPFYKEFRKVVTDDNNNSVIELNEDIKSQQSIHFVLGGDYSFNMWERRFKFTTELYYKKINNLVPYSVNNVKLRYAGENISNGYATGIDMKLFGQFVPGTDSWLNLSIMKARQNVDGEMVPLPTDQPFNISMYFTDYLPNNDRLTMNLRAIWSSGLPFSSPAPEDIYKNAFRASAYRRVDIGMAYLLLKEDDDIIRYERPVLKYFKNVWLGIDVFNLLDIKNVNSYSWISDNSSGLQYAVPNRLTGRQLNFRILAEF